MNFITWNRSRVYYKRRASKRVIFPLKFCYVVTIHLEFELALIFFVISGFIIAALIYIIEVLHFTINMILNWRFFAVRAFSIAARTIILA